MDTLQFLSKVLPDTGYFFIATPREQGGFFHYVCNSHTAMELKIQQLELEEATVYFATAGYREKFVMVDGRDGKPRRRYRVTENVESVRAYWLDLDVGETVPGHPPKYPTQESAIEATCEFFQEVGLPQPMFVSSGFGVHIYWPLTDAIPYSVWHGTAEKLKRLCANRRLLIDPTRTADAASVLRPVGATNRKRGEARPVELIGNAEDVVSTDATIFSQLVANACEKFKVAEPLKKEVDKMKRINDEFLVHSDRELPPSDPELVAKKCMQVRMMRDTKGCVPEPVWYACMQVLLKTTGGRELCHEWSKGYSGYSEAETNAKLDQLENYGPATCSTFEGRNPSGCEGCPFRGTITSPIQLGSRVVAKQEPDVVEERNDLGTPTGKTDLLPSVLGPYRRTEKGLFIEVDGVPLKFYDYDIYPVAILHEDGGGEQIQVRYYLPQEGWAEFRFDASEMSDLRSFDKAMRRNHIQPYLDAKHADFLRGYMDAFIRRLREKSRLHRLVTHFGWHEDLDWAFVHGGDVYRAGSKTESGAAKRLGTLARQFVSAGDFNEWLELTELLNKPGMEAHAFAFCTGFAGPLMPFTNYAGGLVSMNGDTDRGKSTIGRLLASIWGKPGCNWTESRGTELSVYEKLSLLHNLPVYVDEVTKVDPEAMSRIVYAAANGQSRDRLKQDGTLAEKRGWATSVLFSLNGSIYSKLSQAGSSGDAEPEKVRLLEYMLPVVPSMVEDAVTINRKVFETYGHAGPRYVEWLVENRASLTGTLQEAIDILTDAIGSTKPRFMIATAAATIVGAQIAYQLGISKVNPDPLAVFAVDAIRKAMGRIEESKQTPLGLLAEFLNTHVGNRLAVERVGDSLNVYRAVKLPNAPGGITQRLDITEKKVWIYRNTFEAFCETKRADMRPIIEYLKSIDVVTNENIKVSLGKYIDGFNAGGQVRCIEVDLTRPELAIFTEVNPEESDDTQ